MSNHSNCLKEGRKKAQDLACMMKGSESKIAVSTSEQSGGDIEGIKAFMKGLNENKNIVHKGKAIFSANDDSLVGNLFLPSNLCCENLTIEEWISSFLSQFPILNLVEKNDNNAIFTFHASEKNEIFPFKLRDELVQYGISYLKTKQIIVSNKDTDSDDEINYADEMGIEW